MEDSPFSMPISCTFIINSLLPDVPEKSSSISEQLLHNITVPNNKAVDKNL
jgi:hypothetical protein